MSYLDHLLEHARLAVLKLLAEAPSYRANDSVLAQAIDQLGLPVTRDQLRGQLAWLEEQALATLERPTPTLIVATATQRGLDVATGRAIVPGVVRPGPGQ